MQVIRMPMMGNTMEMGVLLEWTVAEGDQVSEDEPVAVVESEKASADVVANQDGELARVDVAEGEEVPPGTTLGVILGPDESLDDAPEPRSRVEPGGDTEGDEADGAATDEPATGGADEPTAEADDNSVPAAPGARKRAAEAGLDLSTVEGSGPDGEVLIEDVEAALDAQEEVETASETAVGTGTKGFASPSTRRLARDLGVSVDDVDGTGLNGRVTSSDVRAAAGETAPVGGGRAGGPSEADRSGGGREAAEGVRDADEAGVTVVEDRELTGARATIADRMARSAREAPHVTLNREVDVDRALRAVEELRDRTDEAVGFNDVLVVAAVEALDAHPAFNAWFEDGRHRTVAERNVALAVDTERGLVTPVVREAGQRSVEGIARERRRLTDAVIEGSFGMSDLRGGTFTISNLGMFGVDSFDPVINPPQVAILGVGRFREGADGRSCTLCLSFDHRVVDGADAARFLDTLASGVEAPTALLAGRSADRQSAATAASEAERADREARDGGDDIEQAVAADIADAAADVAAAHNWPVPTFAVSLDDGDRPTVTVGGVDGENPATLRRLAYAACRESSYADVLSGLRDPVLELE